MVVDLQKASLGKRIIAAIFDGVLLSIIAVGVATLLSMAFGYDGYMKTVNNAYARYEEEYGVTLQITAKQYEALSPQQQENYDTAYQALIADEEVTYAYNMLINLTMLITTFGVLSGVLVVDFAAPLLLKNGQTLGKKIFGIAVMHTDAIRANNLQLFVRSVLGKFAIELMIPLSIAMMIFFNGIGVISLVVLAILLIAQVVCLAVTRKNMLLHDVLAGTVTVDAASQRIFNSRDELIEYTKAVHTEQAAKADY